MRFLVIHLQPTGLVIPVIHDVPPPKTNMTRENRYVFLGYTSSSVVVIPYSWICLRCFFWDGTRLIATKPSFGRICFTFSQAS